MGKETGIIAEETVPDPVDLFSRNNGEPIPATVSTPLTIEPIRLKKKPTSRQIKSIREDLHDRALISDLRNEGTVSLTELKKRLM
ncbi:hypothetical protein [Methanoregula sp.]|jgi:hypothetical protein|uniref:hypothetical protein n=1 Tax=Methanoregula sp. TaxID=2052170 RepID=UPI003C230CAA